MLSGVGSGRQSSWYRSSTVTLQLAITLPSCYKAQYHCILYNYLKADFQILCSTLSCVPWNIIIDYDSDIDTVWSQWCDWFRPVSV